MRRHAHAAAAAAAAGRDSQLCELAAKGLFARDRSYQDHVKRQAHARPVALITKWHNSDSGLLLALSNVDEALRATC